MSINADYLDIDYLKNFKPYYFGLGFIQLKLNDKERLHFYNPKILPILDEEDIHDHRYDFTSKVLCGGLEMDVFYYKEEELGSLEYEGDPKSGYSLYSVSCKQEDAGQPGIWQKFVTPIKLVSFETNMGEEYFITKDAFHRVKIRVPTLTYLKRESPVKDVAYVIRKTDTADVCPFSKKLSDDEIWEVIEDILERVDGP